MQRIPAVGLRKLLCQGRRATQRLPRAPTDDARLRFFDQDWASPFRRAETRRGRVVFLDGRELANALASVLATALDTSRFDQKERDVRAASRAPKRALAPATPSPSSHTSLTRTRAALLPGRDPPPSARGSEVSPARSPPRVRPRKRKPRDWTKASPPCATCCSRTDPRRTARSMSPLFGGSRQKGFTHLEPDRPERVSDRGTTHGGRRARAREDASDAFFFAPSPRRRRHRLVDARLAELRLADETWRRVAFRIARARETRGGTRSPRRRAKSSGGSPPRCRRRRTKRQLSRRRNARRFSLNAISKATESPLRIGKSNVAPIPAADTRSTLFRALSYARKVFAEPPRRV